MEKRRGDKLLFQAEFILWNDVQSFLQMLPPTVAQALQQKKQVTAETYESVTVYFSDIVEFSQILAESIPMEVVMEPNTLPRSSLYSTPSTSCLTPGSSAMMFTRQP